MTRFPPPRTLCTPAHTPYPSLLNQSEAALYLKIKPKTLAHWRWAGMPPSFVRISSAIRYDKAVLDAFIANGRVDR